MKRHLAMNEERRFRIITQAEAEAGDVLVCVPWSDPPLLPDNARGRCKLCETAVQHRPDAPKRPMKLCIDCAIGWVRPH
jgi:hypothetical protein